ncbi:MAG: PTS system mannose/fructose/sorbose family transporter subunit IID, partial [Elusimicrobia bacterium]|nr:PTS system mannose/fructose/sorbose family transporter subunit IID [Elusimicrobiota bacterium]
MTPRMQMRLFARSLLLQACWNFERMQSLGFALCVEPWLERCYGAQDEARREARLRHQEFFNTQPYMAPLVLGMVCALEEDIAAADAVARPGKVARLRTLKTAAAAALAGLGDALFWGSLRPFCAILALSGALVMLHFGAAAAALWA